MPEPVLTADAVDVILGRRSIRREFSPKPIPDDIVDLIIRCGLSAPSSKNAQPWRLHVVHSRATLRALADVVQSSKDAATYVPTDPLTGRPRSDWPSTVAESAEVLRSVPLGIFVENRGDFSQGRSTLVAAPRTNLSAALVGYTFEIVGIGASIQSMWIAAESFGLRGVFMGDIVVAEHHIAESLKLSGDLVGVLALGYSSGEPWIERIYEPDRVVWHLP